MALAYTAVTNPVYADSKNQSISCMVRFTTFPDPLPFIATASDPEAHGAEIFAACVAGTYGTVGAYVTPVQSPDIQCAEAIAKGIVISSVSTPALNGTYALADSDQANINSEAQYINVYQEFTTGTQTMVWADAGGIPHTFPSTASFMLFAKACAQYVSGCKQAIMSATSNAVVSFPSNRVQLS